MRNMTVQPEEMLQYVLGTQKTSTLFDLAHQKVRELNKNPLTITGLEGALISFLTAQSQCKKFVEIGTLTGYSALWISQGMDQASEVGQLWTIEKDPLHAQAAREVLGQYKGKTKIQVVEGDAREALQSIEVQGPFDGAFIDGNKSAYLDYLDWCEKNLSQGGLIIADNIFLRGSVWGVQDTPFSDKQIQIMQEFNRRLLDLKKYRSCVIPTFDGIMAAVKLF